MMGGGEPSIERVMLFENIVPICGNTLNVKCCSRCVHQHPSLPSARSNQQTGARCRKLRHPASMAAEALSTPPPGDIRILVGPVIGFVTNTTARVLVEVDKRCSLSCVLQPVSETGSPVGDPRVVVVDLEPFHPEVARFFYLLPGQR